MEIPFRNKSFHKILEVGAGSSKYAKNLRCKVDIYHSTDIRDVDTFDKARDVNVIREIQDVCSLSYEDDSFDRTIATCVLPHVDHLSDAISEIYRVTKDGGYLTLYIPCEPGIVLRIFRRLITSRKYRTISKYNFYEVIYSDHKHYFTAMNHMIMTKFRESSVSRLFFPIPLPFWNLNFFCVYQIKLSKPK